MASKNNDFVKSNPTTSRTFSYEMGSVRINITLRTDVKSELKSGLEIGKKFVLDVEEELAKLK